MAYLGRCTRAASRQAGCPARRAAGTRQGVSGFCSRGRKRTRERRGRRGRGVSREQTVVPRSKSSWMRVAAALVCADSAPPVRDRTRARVHARWRKAGAVQSTWRPCAARAAVFSRAVRRPLWKATPAAQASPLSSTTSPAPPRSHRASRQHHHTSSGAAAGQQTKLQPLLLRLCCLCSVLR